MRTASQEPLAQILAAWAHSLALPDVPPAILERVKLHILDQIGAQVSCRALPAPRVAQEYAARYGAPGRAAILGTPLHSDPETAGFANATSGSSFEIDDYGGNGAYAHPGCVVVPAALAVSEDASATGAQFLRACVAGFELVIRLAIATMPSLLQERGFHQTGIHGVFAAALVDSMINADEVSTIVDALSIAGSHASGTTEFSQSGGEVKRAHSGVGVAGGIRSARLARLGLTGPGTIFEGRRGFLQAFCNQYDTAPLTSELGSRWHFGERGAIKPYASCGLVHHHFAAYDKIVARHSFAPGDISEILLGCEPLALIHTGSVGPRPRDMVGAQFSAEYGIAMRVVTGRNDVASYFDAEAAGFADPAITAVAERVRLEVDDACATAPPKGRVTLTMRNGEVLSASGHALGSPLNPLSRQDIEEKYRNLVSRDYGDQIAEESLELVMGIEELTDLDELTRLFVSR